MSGARLLASDCELLLQLLRTPTAGPLETGPHGPPPRLWDAQRAYLQAAEEMGFVAVRHAAPDVRDLPWNVVPAAVRQAVADDAGFLASQPSLVLRLGEVRPRRDTVMFNVHLDTVAGTERVDYDGEVFSGRGAIDAKGPAVALLAGVRAAIATEPAIARDTSVLVQAVAGEEGGVMGTIGTKPLVDRGFVGRLNLFCEPTGLRYLPRATAAATARIRVEGEGAVDDRPERGHNATALLGYLAQHLARTVTADAEGRMCIGGLHTGHLHNRVYGTGQLHVNLSYATPAAGRRLVEAVEQAVREGLERFAQEFGPTHALARTAADAAAVTRLDWAKRGLPALDCTDAWGGPLLEQAGVARWPDAEPAFTCDAIWMGDVPDAFTAVCGPGDLLANRAHARGEFAERAQLDGFADVVARALVAFSRRRDPVAGAAR